MASIDDIREKFKAIAFDLGFELVELTGLNLGGRSVIRAFIHKPGGVTVGECQKLSHAYSDYLDTDDVIAGKYILEVSSLGLDRPLLNGADYRRRIGERVCLELKPGAYEQNQAQGELTSAEDSGVYLTNEGNSQHYKYENIIRGKIVY